MHGKFLFSSFGEDILQEIEKLREKYDGVHPRFDVIYLHNYENLPLPSTEILLSKGDGINISANYITADIVNLCHSRGKKLGVWIKS